MKLKRVVSTLMAFSLALSGITMYNSTVPECSFTAVAASSIDSFLESGTDLERARIITGGADSFSMNGYGFNQGIVFDNNSYTGQVCYNVENVDSISFTIGHVDNSGASLTYLISV